MQVSAPVTSLVRPLHLASTAKKPAPSDVFASAKTHTLGKPVEEPPLAKDVRTAAEEILAHRAALAEKKGEGHRAEGPNSRIRARLADLNRMVRRRLASFAESRSASDPELGKELASVSRTFHTAVREAWDAFRSNGDKASLMHEVRAAFELAEAGFHFAASSSPTVPPTAVVDTQETGAGAAGTPETDPNGTFTSSMSGVTVTVSAAPAPSAAAAQQIGGPEDAGQITDKDPSAVLQKALEELIERFESQMNRLDELLSGAFGGRIDELQESEEGSPGSFHFELALKIYGELSGLAGHPIGGLLDAAS